MNNRKIGRVADTASIATIGSDNVMEVGRYVDFHAVGTSVDFSMRLNCNVGELRIEGGDVNIIAGTLTASGDIYSTGTAYFGDAKEIARFSDSWLRLNPADNFTSGIYCGPSTVRTDGKLQVGNNGAFFNVSTAGNVTAAGTITGTDCIATSDRRFKENLVRIENPIEKLNAINGYTFNWVNNPDERVAHTMAQEVQSVYPEAVKEDEAGKLHVSLSAEIALLIEVCKSQQREIDELKRRIT